MTNFARMIVEAPEFTVTYGLGEHDEALDVTSVNGAFARFKFKRLEDGRFEVTTLETKNIDKLKEVDSLTEFNVTTKCDEDCVCQWFLWINRHMDFIGYKGMWIIKD